MEEESFCCLPPNVFDIVCGYVDDDFKKWIQNVAEHNDVSTLKMLLFQRTYKPENFKAWNLFDASLRNPNKDIMTYLIEHFIDKGCQITHIDPFIMAMYRNNIDAAHDLNFPRSCDWSHLLSMILRYKSDAELQYCLERNAAFRDVWFQHRKYYKDWLGFIISKRSMFALDACIASSVVVVNDAFMFKILTSSTTSAIFERLWLHRFGYLFDANNYMHSTIFEIQFIWQDVPILDFLLRLPFFDIGIVAYATLQRIWCYPIAAIWLLTSGLNLDFLLTPKFWQQTFPAKAQLAFHIMDEMSDEKRRVCLQRTSAFLWLAKSQQWKLLFVIMNRYQLSFFGPPLECAVILAQTRFFKPHIWSRVYRHTAPGTLTRHNILEILWMNICSTLGAIYIFFMFC